MKKILTIALVVALALCSMSAFAAGKINVDQENFHVIDDYWVYGYAFAKVSNVGDKPVKINTGLLEIYDANGDTITSTDYYDGHAEYLAPGEYTYLEIYEDIEDVPASDVDDYMLTLTGVGDSDYTTYRFPCTTAYAEDVEDDYWTYDYMYATFTNDLDVPVYDISVVLALLDAEGNILYMDDTDMYDDKAVMPGRSIEVRKSIDSSFEEYFEKEGIVPASVDAIAYVLVENE